MSHHFIAKNSAGEIIGRRTSKSRIYTHCVVNARGHVVTWCGRRDLAVKAARPGQAVLAVEIEDATSAAQANRAKNEAVDKLRADVAKAETRAAEWANSVRENEAMLAAALAPGLPTRTHKFWNGVEVEQIQIPAEFRRGGWEGWTTVEGLRINLANVKNYATRAEVKLANYRKRLAAAERKAARDAQA